MIATPDSTVRGATEPPLIEQTIGDCFDAMVARQPDALALISRHEGIRLTYRQLQAQANRLASALLASGLTPGDRLGIWALNCAAWLVTQLAAAKTGLILVNFNPAYRTSEAEYALNKVGCKALVVQPRYKTSDYLGMLRELGGAGSARLPKLETIYWLDQPGDADEPGMTRFTALLAQGSADDAHVAGVQRTLRNVNPINIQFTSGTTGFPKAATLTHRGILNNGFLVGEAQRFTAQDRLCSPMPLFHCFGMVMCNLNCLAHGATIVYPDYGFDPAAVLQAVQDERCTALYGVPAMFIAELQHPRFAQFDLSSLRTGIMSGAPCPIEVMKQVVQKMNLSQITIAYGMTETSPVSCQSSIDTPLEQRVTTVGQVQPHLEIKVVDPGSGGAVPVPRGQQGELCVRGYSVMQGYWGEEARTREAIDADGWMHTGDLATIDAGGYINIVGRIKDVVIRGGENVYPREVEEFLYRHPKIQDVQVVGLPDEKYGEELCAWIIAKSGQTLTEDEVRAFCKGQIAHYKIPRYISVVTEFPMTASGKIQKFRIREMMAEKLGLKVAHTA
jgi:fatty-acyl-CoA synthase